MRFLNAFLLLKERIVKHLKKNIEEYAQVCTLKIIYGINDQYWILIQAERAKGSIDFNQWQEYEDAYLSAMTCF